MFKIEYDTLAIMPDGSRGNLSMGKGIAYMDCETKDIENKLQAVLKDREHKLHPIIDNIKAVKGHIVI